MGIENGPVVSKLKKDYGSGWQIGWLQKKRQYYSQRMVIINHILHQVKDRINREKLVIDKEKVRYMDEMAK